MTKLLRILAIGVGAVVALVAVSIGAVYVVSQRRIDASLTVAGHAVLIPTDSASIERGRHVVNAIGMSGDCHQADFGGGVMIDVPVIAYLSALNLTSGEGGVGGMLSDLDWERAVRHGGLRHRYWCQRKGEFAVFRCHHALAPAASGFHILAHRQRVDGAQNLIEITPDIGGVGDDQRHLLRGVDDEHAAHRHRARRCRSRRCG